ncbi:hypothetical protein Tco_0623846 [Tanacetum coccineum]|uniref:Uncharacterized protein n=1 Tax=Tanacetum coccineum TaxID=301880 RepID=A0ABQ4WC68_9ASTR
MKEGAKREKKKGKRQEGRLRQTRAWGKGRRGEKGNKTRDTNKEATKVGRDRAQNKDGHGRETEGDRGDEIGERIGNRKKTEESEPGGDGERTKRSQEQDEKKEREQRGDEKKEKEREGSKRSRSRRRKDRNSSKRGRRTRVGGQRRGSHRRKELEHDGEEDRQTGGEQTRAREEGTQRKGREGVGEESKKGLHLDVQVGGTVEEAERSKEARAGRTKEKGKESRRKGGTKEQMERKREKRGAEHGKKKSGTEIKGQKGAGQKIDEGRQKESTGQKWRGRRIKMDRAASRGRDRQEVKERRIDRKASRARREHRTKRTQRDKGGIRKNIGKQKKKNVTGQRVKGQERRPREKNIKQKAEGRTDGRLKRGESAGQSVGVDRKTPKPASGQETGREGKDRDRASIEESSAEKRHKGTTPGKRQRRASRERETRERHQR